MNLDDRRLARCPASGGHVPWAFELDTNRRAECYECQRKVTTFPGSFGDPLYAPHYVRVPRPLPPTPPDSLESP